MPIAIFLAKYILPFLALLLALFYYHRSTVCAGSVLENCQLQPAANPHGASWKTWFHPSQSWTETTTDSPKKEWNIFQHLGGLGPWIEHEPSRDLLTGEFDEQPPTLAPPDECSIDQVNLLSRHAERFPTPAVGDRHLKLLKRIRSLQVPLNGSLAFLNNWIYFTHCPWHDFGQLTTTGPFAGTLSAFTSGVRLRTRYHELIPHSSKTRFWASDSPRVIDSARYFASGFFGLDWEYNEKAELQIIPETFEQGADTLTPGDTCRRYLDSENGHDLGETKLAQFQETYIPDIAKRLIKENPALGELAIWEVYGMQEMCGFETMVRGSSPWCDVFTREDWYHFEYARDLLHYYRAGPGNSYSAVMGWLYLNATTSLLRDGPNAGSLFLNFVHDGDIAPFLTALGLFPDPDNGLLLPTDHIAHWRTWKTSSVLPMGARITLERMTCASSNPDGEVFIRVNVNDRIVPLPFCQDGPGRSCNLFSFEDYVAQRGYELGPYGDACGLKGHRDRITFLHQD